MSSQGLTGTDSDAPEEFKDMVFGCDIMDEPVVAADGFTYNRPDILKWLEQHDTSPKTGAKLEHLHLIPIHDLRSRIKSWKEQQQQLSQLCKGQATANPHCVSSPHAAAATLHDQPSPPTVRKMPSPQYEPDVLVELLGDRISVCDSESPASSPPAEVPAKLVYLKSAKTSSGARFACLRFIENDRANDILLLPGTLCNIISHQDVEFVQLTLPRTPERFLQSSSTRYQPAQVSAKDSKQSLRQSTRFSLFRSSARDEESSQISEASDDSNRVSFAFPPHTDLHRFAFTFKCSSNMNWYCLISMCLQRNSINLIEDVNESAFVYPELPAAQSSVVIQPSKFLHLLAPHERRGETHGTTMVLANRIKQFLEQFPQVLISKDVLHLNFKMTVLPSDDKIIFEGLLLLPWLVNLMVLKQKQAMQACLIRFLKKYFFRSKFASLFAARGALIAQLHPQKLIRRTLHMNCSHINASIHESVFYGKKAARPESIAGAACDRYWDEGRGLRERLPSLRLQLNKHVRDVDSTVKQIAAHSALCRLLPNLAEVRFVSNDTRQFVAIRENASHRCAWQRRILAISYEHIFFFTPHSSSASEYDAYQACLPPLQVQQITPISSLKLISISPFADDAIILHVTPDAAMPELPCFKEEEPDAKASSCRGCGKKFLETPVVVFDKIARGLASAFGGGIRKTHCRGCGLVFCQACTSDKRLFPPFARGQQPGRCCKLCNSVLPLAPAQDIVLRDPGNFQILALISSLRPDIRVRCDSSCETSSDSGSVRINFLPYNPDHKVSDSPQDYSSLPVQISSMASEQGCKLEDFFQKLQVAHRRRLYASLRERFNTACPHIEKTLLSLGQMGSKQLVLPIIRESIMQAMMVESFRKHSQEISRRLGLSLEEWNEGFALYESSMIDNQMPQRSSSDPASASDEPSEGLFRFIPPDLSHLIELKRRASASQVDGSAARTGPADEKPNHSTPESITRCIAEMKGRLDDSSHSCDTAGGAVMFFGNTGVGKSTAVNMLLGKDMVAHEVDGFSCVAVAQGQDEASQIGHSKTESATVKPISMLSGRSDRMLLADFPGFEDSRGFVVNIANMANIKRFFGLLKTGARIVLLFEWISLEASRGKVVKDTCRLLERMFTSENLPLVFDSILIAISKASRHVEQKEYDRNVQTFIVNPVNKALKANLRCADVKLVDPLAEHSGRIAQSCQSVGLWQSILSLRPLENGSSIFTPTLLDSDYADFLALHTHLEELIVLNMNSLQNGAKSSCDLVFDFDAKGSHSKYMAKVSEVAQLVALLRSILVLGQAVTQECLDRCLQSISASMRSACTALEVCVRLDVTKKLNFRQDFTNLDSGCAALDECFEDSCPLEQRPSAIFNLAKISVCSQEAEMQQSSFKNISLSGQIRIAHLKAALQNLQSTRPDETAHSHTAQLEAMHAICSLSENSRDPLGAHRTLKDCLKLLCACRDMQQVAELVRELSCNLFDGVQIEISNRELVFCNPDTASLLTFLRDTSTTCLKLIQKDVKDLLTVLQKDRFRSAMASLRECASLIICSQSSALSALVDLFLGPTERPYSISILRQEQYGFDIQTIIQIEAAVAYLEATDSDLDCSLLVQSFFSSLETDSRTEACRRLEISSSQSIQALTSPIHLDPMLRPSLQNLEKLRRLDPISFEKKSSRKLLKEKLVEQTKEELLSAISNPQPNYREVVSNALKIMDLLGELCVPQAVQAHGRSHPFELPQICLLMDEMRPLLDLRLKINSFEKERIKAHSEKWERELCAAFRLFESECQVADSTHELFTLEISDEICNVNDALEQAAKFFCNLGSALTLSQNLVRVRKERDYLLLCSSLDSKNLPELKHFDAHLEQNARDILHVYRQTLSRLKLKHFKCFKKQILKPLKDACFAIIKTNPTRCLDTPEKCRDHMSIDTQRELELATRELEGMKLGLIEEPFRDLALSIYIKFTQSLSNEANRCALDHVMSSNKLPEHSAELPRWMRALESNAYADIDRIRENLLKSAQSVIGDKDAIVSCIEDKQFKKLETLAGNAQRLSADLSLINMKVSTSILQEVVTRRSQELCNEAIREISHCFCEETPSETGHTHKECELKNLENFMDCCHNVPSEILDSNALIVRIRAHADEEFSTAMKRGQSDPKRIGPLIVKCFLVCNVAQMKQEKIIDICNQLIANANEDHRQAAVDYLSRCKSALVVGAHASQAFERLPVLREKELEKLNSKTGFMKDTMVVAKMFPKPKVGDNSLLELSSMIQKEWNEHIEKFVSSRQRPFDLSEIKARVQVLSSAVKDVLTKGQSLFFCRQNVASILAAIFAAWTILYFQKSGGNEAKIEPNSLIRPHDTQKIAILRLIGVDVQHPPRNHLIQVRTGEGKSISLGVASTFYAIMDQIVHVPCYSPYLSLRDQREFSPLFKLFDVEERIFYCTFTELAHNLMSLGSIVDYRNVAIGVLTNAVVKPATSSAKHLIIFDEVDIFWSQDFFGQCYRAVHVIDCKHAQDLVKYVWKHRSSLAKQQSSIEKIMNEPFTLELLRMYPRLERFLPFEIGKMLEDVDFLNHQNPVAVKPNAIGYVDTSKGAICTETTFGYRTAFAYLNFCENGDLEYSESNRKVGVRVFCGSHLYSELPKIATRILGLSATFPASKSEYDRILIPYNLSGPENRTIMPSTFDKKEPSDLPPIILDTLDKFFEDLKNEIKAMLSRKRPTLIFFENNLRLFEFKNHLEARSIVSEHYRRFEVLTNETPLLDRDDIIFRAGDRCAITLLTRSYGRGTDFKCLHPDVDREGGVHVILTFAPESESELTQIRGRTCRQDCNGSFRVMLCQQHFEEEHKYTEGTRIEDFLVSLRDKFEKQRVDAMFEKLQNHEPQCLASRSMAKAAETDARQAEKILFELQGYGSQPFSGAQSIEVAFLFDATKSMGPYIHAAKERVMSIANDVKRGVAAANPKISSKDLESFVKFAFVGYRDWNASGKVYDAPGHVESFDLSSDIKSLKSFIEQVKPLGGGDLAEDAAGGLRAIESLKWSAASAKCVFMLADAPCHGRQYHSLKDSFDSSSVFNAAAGKTRFDKSVARDQYHNVVGSQYDLSPDGAFNGHVIAVYQAYTGEGFTFNEPKAALEKKGFTVVLWHGQLPPIDEFQSVLDKSCQLWLISSQTVTLSEQHITAVLQFVEDRKGLFLWGDNDPYHADANVIISRLPFFESTVSLAGNFMADKIIAEHSDPENMRAQGPHGFKPHYITTGLESLYEGITISDIRDPQELCDPIITCSDGRSHVTCLYSKDKYRVLIDGGFTRLLPDRWARTAGTARFVTNAACFLAAFEDKADHFLGGDPQGSVPEHQIEALVANHNIKFFFVNICREKTDQMISVWNRHLDSKKLRAIDTSLHLGQSESDGNIMDRFAAQISRAILADFTSPTSRR